MKRVQWLDSLRGISAVIVMLMHIWEMLVSKFNSEFNETFKNVIGFFVNDFFNFGKIGVAAFFLVSGYVIPYSLIGKNLKVFAVSRFFRLYPAYWFSIIIFILASGVPPIMQLLANTTMLQKFFGYEDLIGVYWTLQIELIFYVICAFLFYINKLDNSKFIFYLTIMFLLISLVASMARFILDKKLPVALPLGLAIMFMGLVIRDGQNKYQSASKNNSFKIIAIFVATLLPICFLAYNKDYGFNEKWYKYFVSYVVAIIMFLLFYYKNYHNKLLLFLGKISYSLYLLHPIAALIVTPWLVIKLPILSNIYGVFFIGVLLSIIFAAVCSYIIENTFVKIGKRFIMMLK